MNTQIKLQDGVSIHALLAECDVLVGVRLVERDVSIHALLAECDKLKEERKIKQ